MVVLLEGPVPLVAAPAPAPNDIVALIGWGLFAAGPAVPFLWVGLLIAEGLIKPIFLVGSLVAGTESVLASEETPFVDLLPLVKPGRFRPDTLGFTNFLTAGF